MKSLVVSVHDVSPLTQPAAARILDELRAIGVECMSLLVVPDHHHRAPFLHDPKFCEWLNAQSGRGHEIVIHGYFHERKRRVGESAFTKIMTRSYTANEGEFYDITEIEARELVKKAFLEFAQIGLHPTGFIAPAWLLSLPAETALRSLQIQYTTRLGSVSDFKRKKTHRSQSLVWSVRSGWRRALSLRWNAFLNNRLRTNPLLRVSIHPPDLGHPEIWAQIRDLISSALVERKPMTYQEWVAAQRDIPAP